MCMKKIWLFLLIIFAFQCSDTSTGSSGDDAYITVDFFTDITVNASKSYSFGHSSFNATCDPATSCTSVLFVTSIDGITYCGFASQYKNPDLPSIQSTHPDYDTNSFRIKVYWQADSIPGSVALSASEYTIQITKNNTLYSVTSDNLNATITTVTESTLYTLTFNSAITVANAENSGLTITINAGDLITGVYYTNQ